MGAVVTPIDSSVALADAAVANPAHSQSPVHHCKVCSEALPPTTSWSATCTKCGSTDSSHRPRSVQASLAFTLTALIFYVPSMVFPFMTIDLYGKRNSSTIWAGIESLAESGSVGIAFIVFTASILLPALKLLILFYLGVTAKSGKRQRFKTKLFHFIETIGRWSMLDIFLLAVLVAILKISPWTSVKAEPGAAMFALVVVFTMLASATFDPRVLWQRKESV